MYQQVEKSLKEILHQRYFERDENLFREMMLAVGYLPNGNADSEGAAAKEKKEDIAKAWENIMRHHGIFLPGRFRYQIIRELEMQGIVR